VFVSFGAEIDRATIEKNTVVNALSRVGPGVRLRSGRATVPGANITTQAQADAQPGSPGAKVGCVSQANVEFAEAVIEANEEFAKGYSAIARRSINNVKGISIDPNTELSEGEQKTRFSSTGPSTGQEVTDATFRNRIIGQIFIEDSKDELSAKMGNRISLRADEGKDIIVGRVTNMSNNVIFHALEKEKDEDFKDENFTIGDNVTYGDGAIVHGGLAVTPGTNDPALVLTRVGRCFPDSVRSSLVQFLDSVLAP
jgi:carbonic anhydrase/acetyltransferase-like protein (isoleucine patch superfamily)